MGEQDGSQYAAFIEAELKAELARRESVNTRASTALTTSAGVVTLALAVFAALIGKDFVLVGWARACLAGGLIALLISAICAVVAGFPWNMKLAEPLTLQKMISMHWADPEEEARATTAAINATVIESLRPGTKTKLKFLLAAGICQIVAVAMLAGSTLLVALTEPQVSTPNSAHVVTPTPGPSGLPTESGSPAPAK